MNAGEQPGEQPGPRIGGIWPVAPHLRPQPRSPRGLCVVLTRQAPETGGGYDEDVSRLYIATRPHRDRKAALILATPDAAERARRRWGQTGPDYTAFLLDVLQDDPRGWHRIEFQPSGQGHKPQLQYCSAEALAATLADIKAVHTPVREPTVRVFKAARDDSAPAFYRHYEQTAESSPAPDPLRPLPAGLLAGFEQSRSIAPEHPPDG